ncbi:8410_t:CDS:2, partial [Funneliformis caledonium]
EESKRKRLKLSNNDNNELQSYCDFEVQVSLLDPEYENKINELTRLNKQLLSENEIPKTKLDSRFANQEDHAESAGL